jgi:hypothetical protein
MLGYLSDDQLRTLNNKPEIHKKLVENVVAGKIGVDKLLHIDSTFIQYMTESQFHARMTSQAFQYIPQSAFAKLTTQQMDQAINIINNFDEMTKETSFYDGCTKRILLDNLINTFAKAVTSPISEEVLATIVEPKIAAEVTDNPVPAPLRIKVPLSLV